MDLLSFLFGVLSAGIATIAIVEIRVRLEERRDRR